MAVADHGHGFRMVCIVEAAKIKISFFYSRIGKTGLVCCRNGVQLGVYGPVVLVQKGNKTLREPDCQAAGGNDGHGGHKDGNFGLAQKFAMADGFFNQPPGQRCEDKGDGYKDEPQAMRLPIGLGAEQQPGK